MESRGIQESTVESWGFRKVQWSHGVLGKYSGVMGFQKSTVESWDIQESTVESRGFRKVQWSHGVSGEYSGVTGF